MAMILTNNQYEIAMQVPDYQTDFDEHRENETKELTIYGNDCVLVTISDVEEEQVKRMFKGVVYELRGINL